jgi:hypothetical protein
MDSDWCGFHDATVAGMTYTVSLKKADSIKDKPPAYYNKHYGLLLGFINEHFSCSIPPLPAALELEHYPQLLQRMTMSKDGSGDVYITDPRVGSIFFYDEELLPRAELKGLNRPLGVAIDANGYMLVGNDGRDNVEVYDLTTAEMVTEFGQDRTGSSCRVQFQSVLMEIFLSPTAVPTGSGCTTPPTNISGILGRRGHGTMSYSFRWIPRSSSATWAACISKKSSWPTRVTSVSRFLI